MNKQKNTLFCAAGFAMALVPTFASAQSNSPWLPIPGAGSVTLSGVSQSGDTAYVMGGTEAPISGITSGGASKFKRESFGLKLNYGLSDTLAVDASFAHSKAKVGAADSSSGLGDSTIGLSWRVLDEYESRGAPTVTLRVAGIINGNYDGARLAAIGKDANGYELSILVGKQFTPTLSAWGSYTLEDRSNGVPTANAFDLNVGYSPVSALTLSVGYTSKKYGGSLDIAGPGFSPARFQQVREQRDTLRIGASYAFAANQSLALSLGKLVNGKNTVRDDSIVGIGYSIGF